MKSIRLSLIVYFLLLSTAALGTVSWLSYRMTETSLRERQRDSEDSIRLQSQGDCGRVWTELDRRLLVQARALARSSLRTVHYEAVHSATAITSVLTPFGCFQAPLWLPQFPKQGPPFGNILTPVWLAQQNPANPAKRDPLREPTLYYPRFTHLELSDDLMAEAHKAGHMDYFQSYRGFDGQPMQRSESMGDVWFTLDPEHHQHESLTEKFDELDLKPGVHVRRVTLRAPVSRYSGKVFWTWPAPPVKGKGGKQPAPSPRLVDLPTPTIVIQYASDLEPTLKLIRELEQKRDKQLAELEGSIQEHLRELRSELAWINAGMLAALWLGGILLIRFGLSPLIQMSDAVSQVSVKDFHLPLDIESLPHELQPIALRLSELLEHLQKAFAREKQAAADISHELRTPLAALMTTLEVGLKKDRSPEEYREILLECLGSGKHMYDLVERLLTLARLDAGVVQYGASETDVTELALDCADLIRPLAKAEGLDLRLHLPDEPIVTQTDATKLREVLINLLHNAIQYNKPNGSIDLVVERTPNRVRIEVRDTGIGIKPEALAHIFERFYRADPSRHADTPHAGLGLAIVKSFVDLMGGSIRVESSDAGTTFIVEIPLVAPSRAEAAPSRETAIVAR